MPGTTPQPAPVPSPADVDVLVVGAGFGGLGAAMGLLDRGARVLVCERLDYPGGCAGTFTRRGGRYDAGATLSSGFGPGQLFAGWAGRHAMDLRVSPLDPVVELRAPGLTLPVWADRARFVDTIAGLAGAHADAVRRFFAYQAGVAAILWRVLDDPGLLPPLGAGGELAHLRHLGGYLPVARWLGRPLTAVLARFGLEHVAPLRLFCDAAPFDIVVHRLDPRTADRISAGAPRLHADGSARAYRRGAPGDRCPTASTVGSSASTGAARWPTAAVHLTVDDGRRER